MKNLVIFGNGKIAQAVSYYFQRDSDYNIRAYTCDSAFANSNTAFDKPLVHFDELLKLFPPDSHHAFVAVGYQGMNSLRTEKYLALKKFGYQFASYVSPHVKGCFSCGENTIIMDDVAIQPHAEFGNNVFVWGGAMIGHHAKIGENCWLTGSCAIGGNVRLGKGCFVGLNTTVGHEVSVGDGCMLGAGTLICRNIDANTVLVARDTEPHRLNSAQFTRMSSCFKI